MRETTAWDHYFAAALQTLLRNRPDRDSIDVSLEAAELADAMMHTKATRMAEFMSSVGDDD